MQKGHIVTTTATIIATTIKTTTATDVHIKQMIHFNCECKKIRMFVSVD